jgi:hypothetical protein
MFDTFSHQGNANQSYIEISIHPSKNDYQEIKTTVIQLGIRTVGWNIN